MENLLDNLNIENILLELENKGLLRELRPYNNTGGILFIDNKEYINFASNDYLNLANNNYVKNAAIKAIEEYGCGATASRLMSGNTYLHEKLENTLAELMGTESCLVFGSGFLANYGVLSSILEKDDLVFADKLNHASLIDGMIAGKANWKRYKHKDLKHLENLLQKEDKNKRKYIISDSIFSMDGDIADIKGLYLLCEKYNAELIIDEAHALGVFGTNGAGVINSLGLKSPFLITATFSKALGSYGGFAACSNNLKKYLVNKARSFIYSTGLPPASIGAALGAIELIKKNNDIGNNLLKKVKNFHGDLLNAGLDLDNFESHILTIKIGENKKTLDFSKKLKNLGIICPAIRPPTVPEGTSRLRLSINLGHTDKHLLYAGDMIIKTAREMNLL